MTRWGFFRALLVLVAVAVLALVARSCEDGALWWARAFW